MLNETFCKDIYSRNYIFVTTRSYEKGFLLIVTNKHQRQQEDSDDIHNERKKIKSASARLCGRDQLPLTVSCPCSAGAAQIDHDDVDDDDVEHSGSLWGQEMGEGSEVLT